MLLKIVICTWVGLVRKSSEIFKTGTEDMYEIFCAGYDIGKRKKKQRLVSYFLLTS